MGPLLRLLSLPIKRYPIGLSLLYLLLLGAWSLPFFIGKSKALLAAAGIHAYALMFVSMFSSMVWSSISRPDTMLLPRFRSYFKTVIGIHCLLLVLLPMLVLLAFDRYGMLVGGGLALILALGMATGSGAKWASLVWMLPLLLGIWPEVRSAVGYALIDTQSAPVVLFLAAAVIVYATWQRYTRVGDQSPTLSPADINTSDMRYGPEAVQAANAGKFARWFSDRQQTASANAFERLLGSIKRRPEATARRALSMILLPNLHWRGVLLEAAFTALIVGAIAWLIGAQKNSPTGTSGVPAGLVATYVGMLTAMRFQALHRATLMLRPSLTDVYFALAPNSQLVFTAAVSQALRPALIGAWIFAATMLGALLPFVAPAARASMFAGGMVGAVAASLYGLGIVLMRLDAEKPRMMTGMIVLAVGGSLLASLAGAAFNASWTGGIGVGLVLILLMLGFVAHGDAQAKRWPVRFDMPV